MSAGTKVHAKARRRQGEMEPANRRLDIRVHPAFIKKTSTLASVFGANNGVLVHGDLIGELTLIGLGAGELPTASSIVGDLNLLVAQLSYSQSPHPQFMCHHSSYAKIKPISETTNCYFLRIKTEDKPGVVGQLGTLFGNHGVSQAGVEHIPGF